MLLVMTLLSFAAACWSNLFFSKLFYVIFMGWVLFLHTRTKFFLSWCQQDICTRNLEKCNKYVELKQLQSAYYLSAYKCIVILLKYKEVTCYVVKNQINFIWIISSWNGNFLGNK